jgi:patatin-like phospholipase/acyl hydrolase
MSRYEIEAKDSEKYVVVIGWDRPLQTFFAQVIEKGRDHDWDMRLWTGCIGKKGAPYAAFFRSFTNVWGVSRSWAATDR